MWVKVRNNCCCFLYFFVRVNKNDCIRLKGSLVWSKRGRGQAKMEDTFLLEKEAKSLANSPQTGTHHPASRCQMGIQGLGACRMQLMKGNPSFLSSMDKMGQKAAARSLVYCSLQRKHIHTEHPLTRSLTAQIRPWQTSTLALDASNR